MAKYLSLYLDHPKVGCGWRSYLVLKEGRRWIHLLETETATPVHVLKEEAAHGRELVLKPTRLARRLRAIAKDYGGQDSGAVREALAILRS